MTDSHAMALCDEQQIADLVDALGSDEAGGLAQLDRLTATFPDDPRLRFLKGSFMAGNGDYAGAAVAMRKAVDLAPEYHLARFQLGFLLLTSGQPYQAQEAWGPLHGLPSYSYLRRFVEGLCHLIRDEFAEAVDGLEDGIGRNQENLPMNADMRLIIEGIHVRGTGEPDSGQEPVSAAQMLLQQAALKATRH